MLVAADELFGQENPTDATWSAVQRRWNSQHVLELIALASFYRMIATLLRSARVELEDGMPRMPSHTTR